MEPITLDQLDVFRAVARTGSFSAAGRALGRAQSGVSYAIANLERLLEVELFDRSGHRPVLTEAGEALLADAHATLRRAEALVGRAHALRGGIEGRVAVAVDVMFPTPDLTAVLRRFLEVFPDVELALYTEALGGVAALVASGAADIGIGTSDVHVPAALETRALGALEMVFVAAPGHPVVHGGDREEAVQVVLTDRSDLTEGIDHAVLPGRQWRVADVGTKHALLLEGFGFGGLPAWRVADDLAAGRLVRLGEVRAPGAGYPLAGFWRRDAPPRQAGAWLLETLGGCCS